MELNFQIFSLVHRLIKNQQRLERIVQETLEDFEQNHCVYLELRTTPKSLTDLTKSEYIQSIEKVIKNYKGKLKAKLLISINRSLSLQEAWENLEIVKNSEYCVGIDFSGNPAVGKFRDFLPVFLEARRLGIKSTVHTAEILDDLDTDDILEFRPDRLGHCSFLNELHKKKIKEFSIPIEICFSSNIMTMGIRADQHHFKQLYEEKFKLALCTDDTLLFDTCLNKEFFIVKEIGDISVDDLMQICRDSARMAFSEGVLELLDNFDS